MFLLGSFTSGLFNGASQAASLYNMYQGIAAGAATEDAMKQDQPTPKVTSEPDATTPDTGADTPAGGGGASGGGGGQGADERYSPAADKKPVIKPTTGEDTRRSPADPGYKPTTQVTPASSVPSSLDRERQAYDYTPPVVTSPAQMPERGLPVAPLSVAPSNMPTFDIPFNQPGALSSGQGTAQGTAAQTGPVPPPTGIGPNMSVPMTNAPIGTAARSGIPTQTMPIPPPTTGYRAPGDAPAAQPGAVPVPPATPAPQAAAVPPAPPAPSPPTQTAQGTSAGDVIRGALGIGSAQAAEPKPTPDATITVRPTPDQTAQTKEPTPDQTPAAPATGVSPATAIPTSYPTAGVQPAKPSPTAPPTQAPAPVSTEAKVAPGQTTPSKSSEPVTPAYAPHVDPRALQEAERVNPQLAQWMKESAGRSGGTVTAEQLAATMKRENGGFDGVYRENDIDPATGLNNKSKGVMQMGDAEARTVDPQGRLDRRDPRQAIELSAQYYRWLAEGDRTRGGFGSNSVLTNYAYMRGVGAANDVMAAERMHPGSGLDWIKRANPQVAGFLDKMYGGDGSGNNKVGLHFPPTGQGNGQYSMSAMVTAAHTGGPDALMKYIFTSGPVTGTTDKWRSAQAQVISHMISTGNYASIGAVTDWFSQQAHQGALSHMAAGYEALQSGDMQTASQQLAMAHAFFPDGTFAKFGVSGDGKTLMGQQFDEGTMQPIGQPMRITPDTLAAHMMHLNHPGNFIDALQKFQLTNSELSLNKAKETYFSGRNETTLEKQRLADEKQQRHDDAQADIRQRSDDEKLRRQQIHDESVSDRTQRSHDVKDSEADKYYGDPDNKPANPDGSKMSDDRFATQGQIEHELRRQPQASGELMSTPLARNAAQAIVQGRLSPKQQLDQNNKPTGYTDWVDKDGAARATTDDKTANYFMHLAGANPKRAPGQQGALNITSPVGAGGGSSTAAMQGMGMNMTGQPQQALQTATA
jgi:hypothetical protein